jgi:hypothetical protein
MDAVIHPYRERDMKHLPAIVAAAILAAPLAHAKLPPPTPEQLAAAEQRRADEQARLAREKVELERAQDRIAERYQKNRAAQPTAGVREGDLPNNTKQAPGGAPPEGGQRQSAEAHSAPAK